MGNDSEIVDLGAWIKDRRAELNLTQETLAAKAGCTASMIYKIEANLNRPGPDLTTALLGVLQVPVALQAAFRQAVAVPPLPPRSRAGGATPHRRVL